MGQIPLPLSRLAALARRCPAMVAADGGTKLRHGRPWTGLRGGQGSRRTLQGVASRVWHAKQQAVRARWLQVVNSSPRTVTAGGRAMVSTAAAALVHQIRHPSLPLPLLSMPGANKRVRHASSESLTFLVCFDLQTPSRVPSGSC